MAPLRGKLLLRPKAEPGAEASNQRRRIAFWGIAADQGNGGSGGRARRVCARTAERSESLDKEPGLHSVLSFPFFSRTACSSQPQVLVGQRVSASFQRAHSILSDKDEALRHRWAAGLYPCIYMFTFRSYTYARVRKMLEKQSQRMANDQRNSSDFQQHGASLLII